ncbi:MAG: peptide chain release factor N(5)-glutamine methyltransferase [Phycisphaerales bacterium]|nr:peptide chain release factor N(5)-glutamine methyltransferase [Phycisphaerales bacterium]
MNAKQGTTEKIWTTRELLAWMTPFLTAKKIDSPRVGAEMLLGHVLGCDRTRLYMESDRVVDAAQLARLRDLVRRAAEHEPVQYLVGETWFYAKPYFVDGSTLIPRPSTERVTELAVAWARLTGQTSLRMLDLCTGSGCVVVSVVSALVTPKRNNYEPPVAAMEVSALASDLVPAALVLAARNAARHGVQARVQFFAGDLFETIPAAQQGTFDLITANPPYISDAEWEQCAPNVRLHEPATALRGGSDGLHVIKPLLENVAQWLRLGGRLLLEIAASQAAVVERLTRANTQLVFHGVENDGDNLPRVLVADRVE